MHQTNIILSLLSLQPVLSSNPLHLLLSPQISDAKCLAECLSIQNLAKRTECYQTCKIVQQNTGSPLCQFPHLCSPGWQVACQGDGDLSRDSNVDQSRFEYFHRSNCQLSWRINTQTNKNVVFILAGQDQGGMWHLVQGNMTSSKLEMVPGFGAKYPSVAVIAVDSRRVLDTLTVNLPRYEECRVEEENSASVVVVGDDLIIVIILCVLVIILFVILLAVIFYERSPHDVGNMRYTENLERRSKLITARQKHFDSYDEKKSLKLAIDNTYVAFPNVYEDVIVAESL